MQHSHSSSKDGGAQVTENHETGTPIEEGADRNRLLTPLLFALVLFVIALLPRVLVAVDWAREPVWDGHYYDFGARRIAAGLGYSDDIITKDGPVWHPWCHYPVGYSGFLAAFYWLFGAHATVGTLVNAVIGALSAVLVYDLTRASASETRARIAGLLAALMPGLILYAGLLMTEGLAAFGLLLAAWVAVRNQSHWLRGAIVASVIIGLTTLVRPQTLLVAPALCLLLLPTDATDKFRRYRGRLLASLAILLTVPLMVVMPWTIRNCQVMDGCALVSTNAGWNLAIGATPHATGRFDTLRAEDGCRVVTGQVQQDRCWRDRGIDMIRQDPMRWLRLGPTKLGHTFDHESFQVGYLAEADPAAWPEPRKRDVRAVLTGAHRILLAAAMLGVIGWFVWRRPGEGGLRIRSGFDAVAFAIAIVLIGVGIQEPYPGWPMAVFIAIIPGFRALGARSLPRLGLVEFCAFTVATVCVTHAVFFGEDRYHIVITPLLCILAACALRGWPARSPGARSSS